MLPPTDRFFPLHRSVFRPKPAFVIPSPPGSTFAASVCCHVACGEAEGCEKLLETAGVCLHGDRGSTRPDPAATESAAPARPEGQGQPQLDS